MSTPNLLSIDPGADTGWALFECPVGKDFTMINCGLGRPPIGPNIVDIVVLEIPVHRHNGGKADPNDIIKLALRAGRHIERYGMYPHILLYQIEPHEWKGSVPKKIMTNRIKSGLTFGEQQLVNRCGLPDSKLHNVLDAVGIGKWFIKCTPVRRPLP